MDTENDVAFVIRTADVAGRVRKAVFVNGRASPPSYVNLQVRNSLRRVVSIALMSFDNTHNTFTPLLRFNKLTQFNNNTMDVEVINMASASSTRSSRTCFFSLGSAVLYGRLGHR
jgi:hypothetical protein